MGDASNPFLDPSTLPYGLPLFALVRPEHYREAIVQGMHEQRAEVEAIADDPAPPSFDNTLLALERSGELLRRVLPVFENASSADTDEAIDALSGVDLEVEVRDGEVRIRRKGEGGLLGE